jgi:L-lactate dehydrogenase complex protein LldF
MTAHNPTSHRFVENAREALADPTLQRGLASAKVGFRVRRNEAAARLPEFETLRDESRDIKNHTLAHIDLYLEAFEKRVIERGGHVHWAADAAEAREAVLAICRAAGARTVTKGKSMISEEIGLNAFLEEKGIEPVETDLGEYIIQLRHETPSHIIAPAFHVLKEQVIETFREKHTQLDPARVIEEARELQDEARQVLRERFLAADVGITGANFLIAETGSTVIVTNEGNGDLTQTLPRIHIVLASLEKVVPTLEDASTILRVLARSATGQEFSSYTTFSTGPRRGEDLDGPLHESLPGLRRDRRACLWLGLSRADRCGAQPIADRRRRSAPPAQCVDLLRPLRGRLSDAYPAAEADAASARARVRKSYIARDRALGDSRLGLARQAPGLLPRGHAVAHTAAGGVCRP